METFNGNQNNKDYFKKLAEEQVQKEANISKILQNDFENNELNKREWELRKNFIENIKENQKQIHELENTLKNITDKNSNEYLNINDNREALIATNFHIIEELLSSIENLYGTNSLQLRQSLLELGADKEKIYNSLAKIPKGNKEAEEFRKRIV